MKLNKWTTALAAGGVVSLGAMVQAEEAQNPIMTAVSKTTLSGYVDTSAIWQIGHQREANAAGSNFMPGRSYDGAAKQDGFNLNVVKLSVEKPLSEANWSAGYKVDLLFGPDANTYNTTSTGFNTSDFAVKQAYVALRAPVGNGLDFKMGVFDSIIGYEVFDAGNNPNYSRSYGYNLEPKAHTGILSSYQVTEWFSVAAGIANTTDNITQTINARPARNLTGPVAESEKTYMGAIALTAPESFGALKGATLYGGIVDGLPSTGNDRDVQNYYAGLTLPTPLTGLRFGLAYDYRGFSGNDTITPNSSSSYANAAAAYLIWQATEKLSIASRSDLTWANDGFYYNRPDPSDSGNQLFSETITVDYKLWDPVITRLEFRWDRNLHGEEVMAQLDENIFSVALNVIYKF
jgi:hypothetical protein